MYRFICMLCVAYPLFFQGACTQAQEPYGSQDFVQPEGPRQPTEAWRQEMKGRVDSMQEEAQSAWLSLMHAPVRSRTWLPCMIFLSLAMLGALVCMMFAQGSLSHNQWMLSVAKDAGNPYGITNEMAIRSAKRGHVERRVCWALTAAFCVIAIAYIVATGLEMFGYPAFAELITSFL